MIGKELKQIVDPNNETCCEYHLAHKCKEFALDNHYSILLELSFPLSGIIIINREGEEVYDEVSDKPEHELIFEGCEWILKQKERI